ncbi:hypothetical protein B0H21DRAFT_743137 [Amylocystis lapponica]|nr:hypothetical protein B0H21DRAFT_743137 [Amylocystis lapponica]
MSSSSPLVGKSAKRRNTTLSCAECRRLKLRCSRVFPCSSCVKKGCAAICPDGSLTTGKGNRFVLANTEVLHDKITDLATRVRQLEDALQSAHGQLSQGVHPLLTDELLQIKRPLERESQEGQQDPDPETADTIDAVGSLSITESGHTKFFGTTANAWYLLQNEAGGDDDAESTQYALPADIPWLGHSFPFSSGAGETLSDVRVSLLGLLPELYEARRLSAIYYRHAAWMYHPLPEAEFYERILPRIYEFSAESDHDPMDSHRLAILYMVLALGTLLDLDKPPLSSEATRYYQLGRAALSLDSILESQSIPAIQALILMCHFMFLSFVEGPRWALMGLAVKLAQSVSGLHRDSGKWNLGPEETFRRRSLFYELFTYDSWQSLTFGRPPSFATPFIDCQMAYETRIEQGETEMCFDAWKHRFVSRCLNVVHEQAFGARVPAYRAIQDLDKRVRDFYVPPSLRVPGFGGTKMEVEPESCSLELTMQRHCAFAIREITIFYIHRGFFARAVEDHPEDPLGSKYAPSVLAAYNSACSFVGLIKSWHSQQPGLTERMWFLFTHVFSCAIVLGSIPTKCPKMALAPSALSHLDSAYSLFEGVANNAHAGKVLPVLRKLKGRALAAMSEHHSRSSVPSVPRHSQYDLPSKEDEELAALGGKTRLVSRKSPSTPSSPQGSSSRSGSSPRDVTDQMQPFAGTSPGVESSQMMSPVVETHVEQWAGYAQPQDVYGYGQQNVEPAMPEHWQHQHEVAYGHMYPSVNMDVGAVQYQGYAHVPQHMAEAYLHQQPLDSQVPLYGTGVDTDASWRSLYAQFNQA